MDDGGGGALFQRLPRAKYHTLPATFMPRNIICLQICFLPRSFSLCRTGLPPFRRPGLPPFRLVLPRDVTRDVQHTVVINGRPFPPPPFSGR